MDIVNMDCQINPEGVFTNPATAWQTFVIPPNQVVKDKDGLPWIFTGWSERAGVHEPHFVRSSNSAMLDYSQGECVAAMAEPLLNKFPDLQKYINNGADQQAEPGSAAYGDPRLAFELQMAGKYADQPLEFRILMAAILMMFGQTDFAGDIDLWPDELDYAQALAAFFHDSKSAEAKNIDRHKIGRFSAFAAAVQAELKAYEINEAATFAATVPAYIQGHLPFLAKVEETDLSAAPVHGDWLSH